MGLDPNIWGPHYWFVIHSIALNYPKNPNDTTKKKYYTFIHDLPLFLPDSIAVPPVITSAPCLSARLT